MKKIISIVLVICLLFGMALSTTPVIYAAEIPVNMVNAERMNSEDLVSDSVVYMGAASIDVLEEDAEYIFSMFRDGNCSDTASVELVTSDLSAVYGEDYYIIADEKTEVLTDGLSMLQRYALEDSEEDEYEEFYNVSEENIEIPDVTSYVEDAGKNELTDEELFNYIFENEDSTEIDEDENDNTENTREKSSLAKQKEEQTGLPTREPKLTQKEEKSIADDIMSEIGADLGNYIDPSSITKVIFNPDEDVKTFKVRILNDNISEGPEGFSMMLSNPENTDLYGITATAVTIIDSDPVEHSTVSFASQEIETKDGKAKVTIKREGAEYSLVDMVLRTKSDTAEEGVNFAAQNGTVAFQPYETEKTVEIEVSGKGDFEVELSDLKGCEAGSTMQTTVHVDEPARVLKSNNEQKEFEFRMRGNRYTVEYKEGDATGKIYDKSYTPALDVGTYYFPLDTKNGGEFNYGKFGGDKPNGLGNRKSEYVKRELQSQSNGKIEYYNATTWKNGYSYADTDTIIPSIYYQTIAADWASTKDFGSSGGENPQLSYMEVFSNSGTVSSLTKTGKFSRATNGNENSSILKVPYLRVINTSDKLGVKIAAKDEDKNRTPKTYIELYGVAAFYKKYRVSIKDPTTKSYKHGSGSVDALPAQVKTASGAQVPNFPEQRDVYTNLDPNGANIVFQEVEGMINAQKGMFGNLIGYSIAINPAGDTQKVTVQYPEDFIEFMKGKTTGANSTIDYSSSAVEKEIKKINSDLRIVPTDEYFADWIETKQPSTVKEAIHYYYQKLDFTPKFEYSDVKVKIVPSVGGEASFNDANFVSGRELTYHAGDTLDLSAAAVDTVKQRIWGYDVSTDGGVNFDTVSSTNELFLRKNHNYVIRPRVTDNDNRIEIKFASDEAKENLHVLNLVKDTELPSELKGNYYLKVDPKANTTVGSMIPTPGEVYQIETIVTGSPSDDAYIYRPVIKTKLGITPYNTQCLDYTATSNREENIVTVDIEKVKKSELTYFRISGTLESSFNPIREVAAKLATYPLEGYSVYASGEMQQIYNSKTSKIETMVNRVNATSDEKGRYLLEGISGKSGDLITIMVTDGNHSHVVETLLTSEMLTPKQITHSTIKPDPANNTNHYEQNEVTGYEISEKKLEIKYPSNAPYVTSIAYTYEKPDSINKTRLTDNSVRMFDDTLVITTTINPKGREISKVIITAMTVTGDYKEYSTLVDNLNPTVFNTKIPKMLEELHNGDKLFVRLVDKEKKEVVTQTCEIDADGNVINESTAASTFMDIEYPNVDTGLVTYIENEIVNPQTYDLDQGDMVDIPLLGNMRGYSKSGIIAFDKYKWNNNTGYTLAFNLSVGFNKGQQPSDTNAINIADNFMHNVKRINKNKDALQMDYEKTCEYILTDMANENMYTDEERQEMSKNIDLGREASQKAIDKKVGKDMAGMNSKRMSINAVTICTFEFIFNPVQNQYVFSCGAVCIGGSFSYNKTFYSLLGYVPVYLQLGGTLQVDFPVTYTTENGRNAFTEGEFNSIDGNISERLSTDTSGGAYIMLGGKIQVGIGLCGVLGARGYLDTKLQFSILGNANDGPIASNTGVMFNLNGGIGIDIIVASIQFDFFNIGKGTGCFEGQTKFSFFGGMMETSGRANSAVSLNSPQEGQSVSVVPYNKGTTDMSSFGKSSQNDLKASPEPVNLSVLLEDANERTRPKIVELGDGRKFMVFIADAEGREDYNSACLMYSVYTPEVGWSEGKEVDDDGTFDSGADIYQWNNKVFIAWTDAKREFTASDRLIDKLMQFDISYAVYDFDNPTNPLSSKRKLNSDDDKYLNQSPNIIIDEVNEQVYCTYMKRDLESIDLSDPEILTDFDSVYSSMAYCKIDMADDEANILEKLIPIKHDTITDPTVFDYQTAGTKVANNGFIISAYTIDEGEDLRESENRELYLSFYDASNDKQYYPIRITNDNIPQTSPQLNVINDKVILSFISEGCYFNILDVTDMLEAFEEADYFSANQDDKTWYKKDEEYFIDKGGSAEEYEGSEYEDMANDVFSIVETNLLADENEMSVISSYKLVSDGKDAYLFYTDFGDATKNASVELYGARYCQAVETADEGSSEPTDNDTDDWTWTKSVKITDFGKVIDEFDLVMNSDAEISLVSNFYEQYIDDDGKIQFSPNKLVEIDFGTKGSVEVVNGNVDFPSSFISGNEENIYFTVENNGLLTANGYDIVVKSVVNGSETIFFTDSYNQLLKGGCRVDYIIPWTVPENISNSEIIIEIEEHGVTMGDYSITVDVPDISKLEVDNIAVECTNESTSIDFTVANIGNINAGSAVCTIYKINASGEKVKTYKTVNVESLASGDMKEISELLDIKLDDFDDRGVVELLVEITSGGTVLSKGVATVVAQAPVKVEMNEGVSTVNLKVGESKTIAAKVGPWSELAGDNIFTSESKAIVNVNENGEILAVGAGTTQVYVEYPSVGLSEKITVNVTGGNEVGPIPWPTPPEEPNPEMKFTDVNKKDWFYDDVYFAFEKEIMQGFSETKFAPDDKLTRAMAATVLFNMSENLGGNFKLPAGESEKDFDDVDKDAWYGEAVEWASSTGVVLGKSDTEFAPTSLITRQDLSIMIVRYCEKIGIELIPSDEKFADDEDISRYAKEGVYKLNAAGVIKGKKNNLFDPKGFATRAETAAIIKRTAYINEDWIE